MTTLAIDIGGTKLAAALVDIQHLLLEKSTLPTPASKAPKALTDALGSLASPFAGRYVRVATASTGIIRHGVMTALNPDNLGGLVEFSLRETLMQLTGQPGLAVNDAQAAAWVEHQALPAHTVKWYSLLSRPVWGDYLQR
jgi:N-acylmannosamine kinase